MSTVKTDAIETAAGGTSVLTLGTATQTLKILGGTPGSTKVLTSDATGGATWAAAGAAGGFHQQLVKTASDTTYSPDTDVTKIIIEAVGGGGGSSNTGGAKGVTGAAGGGYARVSLAVTSATVINIQIGTAGAAGVGSEGVGQDGGATTVTYVSGGSSFTPAISANGGEKGTIAAGVQPTTDGGTATGPTGGLYIQGEMGAAWCANDSNQWGGGNPLGFGGRPLSTGNPRAQLGTGYGAGASGANEGTGEGDPGTQGVVIITEYK